MISAEEKHFLQNKAMLRLAGAKWLNSSVWMQDVNACSMNRCFLQSALYKEIPQEND